MAGHIIRHQGLGHAAEVPESVFQTTNQLVGGLPINRFAICFARVAQDDAKDVRTPSFAVGAGDGDAAAKINLGFFAGSTFHAAEGQVPLRAQAAHKAADAVVVEGEAVVADQVLVNPLRRKTRLELVQDDASASAPMIASVGASLATASEPMGALAGFELPSANSEPMGALAGFDRPEASRRCRATVSRWMFSSRAMRRCDQRRRCSVRMVSMSAILS